MLVAWSEKYSRDRLPSAQAWGEIRELVAQRAGGRCQAVLRDGSRCVAAGSECDHIRDRYDCSLDSLQWLCSWHHAMKTRGEAREGAARARERNLPKPRKHPGLL